MAPIALALCLCATVLLSAPPPAHAYIGHPYSPPRPSPETAESTSSSEYKIYIILLKPRVNAEAMDNEARQRWYRSFLPDEVTADGKPRLVCSYKTIFHGFAAWLTEEELDAASKKPGFGGWFPNRIRYPAVE